MAILGRNFDSTLIDDLAKKMIKETFSNKLSMIDKTSLTGFRKAWIMYHIALFQIRWDLSIYEVPTTSVEELEVKQNVYAREWLVLPRCTSDMALYFNNGPCPLPLKSNVARFKETKVVSFLQLKYLKDLQTKWTSVEHISKF